MGDVEKLSPVISRATSPRHLITPPPMMISSESLTRPRPLQLDSLDAVDQQLDVESSPESEVSITPLASFDSDSKRGCLESHDSTDCESDLESIFSDSSVDSSSIRLRRFAVCYHDLQDHPNVSSELPPYGRRGLQFRHCYFAIAHRFR